MLIDVAALKGELVLVTGKMNSGKTETLITAINKLMHSAHADKLTVFSNNRNSRDGTKRLFSYSGLRSDEVFVANAEDPINVFDIIQRRDRERGFQEVLVYDEGNLHTHKFVSVVKRQMEEGRVVVVAGLNLDFRGESFGPMGRLEEISRGRETISH